MLPLTVKGCGYTYLTTRRQETAVFLLYGGSMKRIASISIIVESSDATERINSLLHDFSDIIIGRMGLPLREYSISLITLCIMGEDGRISALSGALGRVEGVSVKTSYAKKEIE